MPSIKTITSQRSTLVLAALWILLNQASNSDTSEALSLSSLGQCSLSVPSSDIYCGASTSTLSTDIIVELDCSQPSQIAVYYDRNIQQRHEITMPVELLLNCSSDGFQTESLCLLWYFGSTDLPGPYILSDDGLNMINPGSTCFISTCFATDAYEPLFLTPPISCPNSPASSTSSLTVAATTVLADTRVSTGESSIAATPTVSKLSSSVFTAATTHTLTGGKPVNTPTITTRHSWSTNIGVTVSTSFTIDKTKPVDPDFDISEQSGIILVLPMILGAVAVVILMLAVPVWIWCLKAMRNKNKIFFVYNKNDMVFDPFHAPVSVETPAGFQHDKMSMVSVDALQKLNSTNEVLLKEPTQITSLHSNVVSTSISDPSSCTHQSSMNTSTENGDSEEKMYIGINGPNDVTKYSMTTCSSGISDCESPTLNDDNNCKQISLDDSAMGSDVFSIHTPISTQDSVPGPSYCHLNSRCIKHYWNFSPQKTVQTEKMTDLDNNDLVLEDCMTLDNFSTDLTNAGRQVHTVMHNMLSHAPESENNAFPSSIHSEDNLIPVLSSRKDVDNEQKVTDPPVVLLGNALENLSEDKANMLYSSSEYVQSHVATSKSWNVKPLLLTQGEDHFKDDIALDLTAVDDHLSDEYSMEENSINVHGSSEYFPPLHFTFMDEITCHKAQSDNDNSDMKCNEGCLPDNSLYTSSSSTGSHVGLQLHNNAGTKMFDSGMEVDGILCTSLSEICKPGSHCSSNESGYYDYVPSFDLEPFNRNTLQTTTTSSDILPLDNDSSSMTIITFR